jgi:uncharacterized protein (TIGR03084 family)
MSDENTTRADVTPERAGSGAPQEPDALAEVVADLLDEGAAVDALLDGRPDEDWTRATPAAGWDVAHQVAHLAWTDRVSLASIAGEPTWTQTLTDLLALSVPVENIVDVTAAQGAKIAPAQLREGWRRDRLSLAHALLDVPDGTKLSWFGPPMSARSMATARLMETWAHGTDIADTLGVELVPTARLRHIAHLGWRTRGFAYRAHDLAVPEEPVRVELVAPDGATWVFGPDDAPETVTGTAYDFCLLVTQRRHRDDTNLVASGPESERWLGIAQAFAGPPGAGRAPQGGAS